MHKIYLAWKFVGDQDNCILSLLQRNVDYRSTYVVYEREPLNFVVADISLCYTM